jgi:hypothetical protein
LGGKRGRIIGPAALQATGGVAQHRTGTNTRQLVLVADEDQPRPWANGAQELGQQRQVHHRRLVDDDGVRWQVHLTGGMFWSPQLLFLALRRARYRSDNPAAMVDNVRVLGFLPSTSGLHFTNYYPHEPTMTVTLPMGRVLAIGDAANGLCGGMVFTVVDFFQAHQAPPADTNPPTPDTALYQYIVKRLYDSFNQPTGISRFLELMEPAFPDVGLGFGVPGRASVMLNDEWPRIKGMLDGGQLAPLGLVKVKSDKPRTSARTTRCWPTATTWMAPISRSTCMTPITRTTTA